MSDAPALTILLVALALSFALTAGWTNASSNIGTVISTRALPPLVAVCLAAVLSFLGAYLSTRVAVTIGTLLLDAPALRPRTVSVAGVVAIGWVLALRRAQISASTTHALLGSLLGAVLGAGAAEALHGAMLTSIVVAAAAPLLGLGGGFLGMAAFLLLFRSLPARMLDRLFSHLQPLSFLALALANGGLAAQKAIGLVWIALLAGGGAAPEEAPFWAVSAAATLVGVGTIIGGWRSIRSPGLALARIRPAEGFATELVASAILAGALWLGMPVSATQVITASLIGVSVTKTRSVTQLEIDRRSVGLSLATLPACLVLSAVASAILSSSHA